MGSVSTKRELEYEVTAVLYSTSLGLHRILWRSRADPKRIRFSDWRWHGRRDRTSVRIAAWHQSDTSHLLTIRYCYGGGSPDVCGSVTSVLRMRETYSALSQLVFGHTVRTLTGAV